MKILYASSEALPFVSTGGLADVIGSLPYAVKNCLNGDCDVRVVLPMYSVIKGNIGWNLEFVSETNVSLAWRNQYCGIWKCDRGGVTFYFIDNEYYFDRQFLYGNYDDGERFAFFGKAIIELMRTVGFIPDILHANDWQSAPAVIYLKRKFYHDEALSRVRVLFTIHNIEYQGIYDMAALEDIFDLSSEDRSIVEYNGKINLLKGALVCAEKVSTVSERYANEILTEYYSCGLHHILRICRDKLTGITNGIDTDYYNPETDREIKYNYTSDSLYGKKMNKSELKRICGLSSSDDAPVIVMVSRLVSHKGFDLVRRVLYDILKNNDISFAILGTGETEYEDFFSGMSDQFPGRVSVRLEYNKSLSKMYYAGGDIFLMPSKSEPCGLSQMIASRYGAVPIVRETGGLYDTIKPYNEYTGSGNGFSFTNYNAHDMMSVIEYALSVYTNKKKWKDIVKKAMSYDFSWNRSAVKYADLYESML